MTATRTSHSRRRALVALSAALVLVVAACQSAAPSVSPSPSASQTPAHGLTERRRLGRPVRVHEIFGLSDWAQNLADEVAEAGYIAVAPDLLSGMAPGGGRTPDFPGDKVTEAVSHLNPDQVTADLNAVADYGLKLPASNGKLYVGGFCWGGGQTFRFATNRPDLSAAFVFYGPPPDKDAMARIKAPVYGFYAGNDQRIGATLPDAIAGMKAAGKTYEPVTYEGAGMAS